MRRNYTAETVPYELEKDRSRVYVTPSTLRELHLRPGAAVRVGHGGRHAVLRIAPKFDGDDLAVYLPQEELGWLGAKPGSAVQIEKDALEYPEAEQVTVVFETLRKSADKLESVKRVVEDKGAVHTGMALLGGVVQIGGIIRADGQRGDDPANEPAPATPANAPTPNIPPVWFRVTERTTISLKSRGSGGGRQIASFGRSGEEIKKFLVTALLPKKGRKTAQGLLVLGGLGMGKSTLCRQLLEESGGEWVRVRRTKDLLASYEYAKLNEPGVLWIERLDRLAEDAGKAPTVLQVEEILEDIHARGRRIAVVATALSSSAVPDDLKKAWVLDKEVFIAPPSLEQRRQHLVESLACSCAAASEAIAVIANRTAGFSRGDLAVLLRSVEAVEEERAAGASSEVVEQGLQRLAISQVAERPADPAETTDRPGGCPRGCLDKIAQSIVRISPSASDEHPMEVPHVSLAAICGQEAAKTKLLETVIWPIQHRAVFAGLGLSPPKGLLLYGPPGCGKTLMAQALANESGAVFHSVRGPEIMGKYVGESEERLRRVFHRARAQTPSIVFIDEIDSIAPPRESDGGQVDKRVVSTLLTEMDGVGSGTGVFVLGATNKPWSIDSALLRPGRFDYHVLLDLPTASGRAELLRQRLQVLPASLLGAGVLEELAAASDGQSGAEIVGTANELLLGVARHRITTGGDLSSAELRRLAEAVGAKAQSRLSPDEVSRLQQWGGH